MLVPDDEWVYAPYLVFDARRVLASVLSFSADMHASAYSIPVIAVELGVQVQYRRDRSLGMLGLCARMGDDLVIAINDAIECSEWDMAVLIHELGHAVVAEQSLRCGLRLRNLDERNAWVRGIYVAISRPLVEAIADGSATPRDVAARCSVPTAIVLARLAIARLLGEVDGDVRAAEEDLRVELLMIEGWIADGRSRGFREWSVA